MYDSPEKVNKERHDVVIYLDNCKIKGAIYLMRGSRISDFINAPAHQFVPVTDATISSIRVGEEWEYNVEFLDLNKNFVITIFPLGAVKNPKVEHKEKAAE